MISLAVLAALSAAGAFFAQNFAAPSQEAKGASIERHAFADKALQRGRYSEARRAFLQAYRNDPENATLMYGLACACSRLGEKGDAFRYLARARELGFQDTALARSDSDLSMLRYDARFQELFPAPDGPQEGTVRWRFTGSSWGTSARGWEGDWFAVAPAAGYVRILEAATGEQRFAVVPGAAPTVALAASPNGDLLASLDAEGRLGLIDPTIGALTLADAVPNVSGDGWPARLAFAADGQRILATTNAGLVAWSCDGQFLRVVAPAGKGGRQSWRLRDASRAALAIEIDERSVHLHDVAASEPAFRTLDFPKQVRTAALSVDGAFMAVGTTHGGVHLVDAATGATLWSTTVTDDLFGQTTDLFGSPVNVSTLAFDPAGVRLAICTTSGYLVTVFDVATGGALWRSSHLGGRMGTPMSLTLGAEVLVGDSGRFFWEAATGEKLGHQLASHAEVRPSGRAGLMTLTKFAVELLDSTTGKRLWRYDLGAEPAGLTSHPSGWVGGVPLALDENLDPWRFDPKRIRAAFAGMALVPAPVNDPDWKARNRTSEFEALESIRVGMPVPEIEGQDFEGNTMRLSDYYGKVTVLEFSRRSSPLSRARCGAAEALIAKYSADPVAWVGVSSDTRESYRKSTSALEASWPSFYDGGTASGPIATGWGVTGWPTIFVIDHEGILRHRGVSIAHVESLVLALLKRIDE